MSATTGSPRDGAPWGVATSARPFRLAAACALAAALGASPASAQSGHGAAGTFVIRGGTVVTGTGQRREGGSVLVQNGRIAAVGAAVDAPAGATEVDARGKFVYPGMIDSNTALGLSEIGSVAATQDRTELGDFNPNVRAIVAVNPSSELIPVTRVNGVTTAVSAPGGGLVSGQAALLHLDGWTWEEMAVRPLLAVVIQYPRATGGGGFGGFGPQTPEQERAGRERMGRQVEELRSFLTRARDYHQARTGGGTDLDVQYEALRPLFKGEVPALVTADTRDQIEGALKLADDFGLKLVIQGGDDAWKLAAQLALKQVPVILGSIQSLPARDAPYDALFAQPGILHRAGVKFAFSTGDAANSRHLPYHAALAVAYGLPADVAFQALTTWPAQIWGVADRLGSIEPGKDADLFIATGDPLDIRTVVTDVFIAGKRLPSDDRHTRLYQKYSNRPKP